MVDKTDKKDEDRATRNHRAAIRDLGRRVDQLESLVLRLTGRLEDTEARLADTEKRLAETRTDLDDSVGNLSEDLKLEIFGVKEDLGLEILEHGERLESLEKGNTSLESADSEEEGKDITTSAVESDKKSQAYHPGQWAFKDKSTPARVVDSGKGGDKGSCKEPQPGSGTTRAVAVTVAPAAESQQPTEVRADVGRPRGQRPWRVQEEAKRRACNVVVGLRWMEEDDDWKDDRDAVVKQVLHLSEAKNMADIGLRALHRIGTRGGDPRPRLVKLFFESPDRAWRFMRNRELMVAKQPNLLIKRDRSRQERMRSRRAWEKRVWQGEAKVASGVMF